MGFRRSMPDLRVLHVIGSLEAGGAEAILYRLATAPSDVEHHIVSLGPPAWYSGELARRGVRVDHLGATSVIGQLGAVPRILGILRDVRPDVVQSWMYVSNILAGVATKAARVPLVWGIHCAYFATLSPMMRALVRLSGLTAGALPTRIVNCSLHSIAAHEPMGFDKAEVDLVPNGYDTAEFAPDDERRMAKRREFGVTDKCFLLGCVARWHVHKDHSNLVQALGRLESSTNSDWRCILVGPGMDESNRDLLALLQRSGCAERFICVGPRSDIPDVLRALDLHVLPSMEESFPNAVAEAMACGTPCIATDVGDTRLIVGETGWIVPPRNATALADAIAAARSERVRDNSWQQRRRAARERIVRCYGLETMVQSYRSVWQRAAVCEKTGELAQG